MINTSNYGVTVGSPLLFLFQENEEPTMKTLPIHISIIN